MGTKTEEALHSNYNYTSLKKYIYCIYPMSTLTP